MAGNAFPDDKECGRAEYRPEFLGFSLHCIYLRGANVSTL